MLETPMMGKERKNKLEVRGMKSFQIESSANDIAYPGANTVYTTRKNKDCCKNIDSCDCCDSKCMQNCCAITCVCLVKICEDPEGAECLCKLACGLLEALATLS